MDEMRLLTAAEKKQAITLMVRAFYNDPAWIYVIPRSRQREKALTVLYHNYIAFRIGNRQVFGIGDPLLGLAVWDFPGTDQSSAGGLVEMNPVKKIFTPGMGAFTRRLKQMMQAAETLKKPFVQGAHYYLETLAIAPEVQGRGLASKLVRPVLARADTQSCFVYLDTFNGSHLALYKHYGFIYLEQHALPQSGLQLWLLKRPCPQPKCTSA